MDDPNEGVLVLTFNREAKTLHRYTFNLSPTEQVVILQKIQPLVLGEFLAYERAVAKRESPITEKEGHIGNDT